jgi:hypothetical protein
MSPSSDLRALDSTQKIRVTESPDNPKSRIENRIESLCPNRLGSVEYSDPFYPDIQRIFITKKTIKKSTKRVGENTDFPSSYIF